MNKPLKQADEIFCPECGKPIKRNAVLCQNCGTKLKELDISTSKKQFVLENQEYGSPHLIDSNDPAAAHEALGYKIWTRAEFEKGVSVSHSKTQTIPLFQA